MLTNIQREILRRLRDPAEISHQHIATEVGCSKSYVATVASKHSLTADSRKALHTTSTDLPSNQWPNVHSLLEDEPLRISVDKTKEALRYANDPLTDPEDLEALSEYPNRSVQLAAAQNVGAYQNTINKLATNNDIHVRSTAAWDTSEELLPQLSADPHERIRSIVPHHWACNDATRIQLLHDSHRDVRAAAIIKLTSSLDMKTVGHLLSDPDVHVRRMLAGNAHLRDDTVIQALLNDHDRAVRYRALTHKNCPRSLHEVGARDSDPKNRSVAASMDLDVAAFDQLCSDHNTLVLQELAHNQMLPNRNIKVLAQRATTLPYKDRITLMTILAHHSKATVDDLWAFYVAEKHPDVLEGIASNWDAEDTTSLLTEIAQESEGNECVECAVVTNPRTPEETIELVNARTAFVSVKDLCQVILYGSDD